MVMDFLKGDIKKACEAQLKCLPLIDALFCEVNPIPIKEALNQKGYDFGIPRLPLVEMSETGKQRLKKAIQEF